jgi:hypothetical protein
MALILPYLIEANNLGVITFFPINYQQLSIYLHELTPLTKKEHRSTKASGCIKGGPRAIYLMLWYIRLHWVAYGNDALVLRCSFLVRVSVHRGILTMTGSSWREKCNYPNNL